MCWNYEVSLGFSLVYLVINLYYLLRRPPYWFEYFMFGMFYFIMEAYQTLQWLYGEVELHVSQFGSSSCTPTNTNFTLVAHILIWLQPILFAYIGYRTTTSANKKFATNLLLVSWIVLFYSLVLLQGEDYTGIFDPQYYQISDSIFGRSTCTSKGATGHLVWRYKPTTIDYFPNYLMYLIMCVLAFSTYDRSETRIIAAGWVASLIITKIYLAPTILEVASSWCLLSVVANVMIVMYLRLPNINTRFLYEPVKLFKALTTRKPHRNVE